MTARDQLNPEGETPAERLLRYVRAAAALRLEILAFERDRIDAANDARIVYCVDTNIILLYLRPHLVGPRSARGGGYGVVFPEDTDEVARVLGAALSRYIFHVLAKIDGESRSFPLVLLPGHDAEARGIYDALSKSLAEDNMELAKRRAALLELLDSIFRDENADESSIDQPKFYDLLYGSTDDVDQLNRFNNLITSANINRLPTIIPRIVTGFNNEEHRRQCRDGLSVPITLHDQIQESALRLAWEKRLLAVSRARSPRRMGPDTAALARLEMINSKLKPLNTRLVLITGDEAMHHAAREYAPGPDETLDFGNRYLRHPRAFLSSTQILARGETFTDDDGQIASDLVVNWLDALLARYYRDYRSPEPAALRRIAFSGDVGIPEQISKATDSDPTVIDNLKREWDSHIGVILKQHAAVSHIARGELRRVLGASRMMNRSEIIRELDALLVRRSETTWQNFFEAMVHAGFDIAQSDGWQSGIRNRNVPPISFDSFRKTSDFVRDALSVTSGPELRNKLRLALPAIDLEDPTGYAKMLAYATLHAFDGNWYIASILADRAIGVAKRVTLDREAGEAVLQADAEGGATAGSKHVISGREAYYFSAVAKRHCVRRKEELEEIFLLLDYAEVALDLDLARPAPPRVDNLRFRAERLACELTGILLDRFSPAPPQRATFRSKLTDIIGRLGAVADSASEEAGLLLNAVVRHNCLINIFMSAALLDDDPEESMVSSSGELGSQPLELARYYRMLGEPPEALAKDGIGIMAETRLVRAIRIYADACFAALSPSTNIRLRKRIDSFRRDLSQIERRHLVMPYDADRFEFLMRRSQVVLSRRVSR